MAPAGFATDSMRGVGDLRKFHVDYNRVCAAMVLRTRIRGRPCKREAITRPLSLRVCGVRAATADDGATCPRRGSQRTALAIPASFRMDRCVEHKLEPG